MLSAIATLVLMLTMVLFPLLIPITVTVGKRLFGEKPSQKPGLRIKHGFEQLSVSR